MRKFLLSDSSGKKSTTVTIFIIGSIVCIAKLAVSGLTIGSITLPEFSGAEFGMALAALGGVYVLRRSTSKEEYPGGE